MKRLATILTTASLSAAVCGVFGCHAADDKNELPLQAPVKSPHRADKDPLAPPPIDVDPFTYSPVGKRDPFRSYLSELAEQNNAHHPERKLEATEYFEIDQYHLTGLITGISQPKAMVEDPDGHGHVVHIGSRIGKNGGLVSQINVGGILIIEETHDPMGKTVQMPVTLKLVQAEVDTIANH
jgi:type IV pilus assembly protein PilP